MASAAKAAKKQPAKKKVVVAKAAASSGAEEKVAGLYRSDTPKAKYLTMLADGNPHTLAELAKEAGVDKYPNDPIYYLRKDGDEKKLWKIEHDKETKTYTMTLMAAGKKALGK